MIQRLPLILASLGAMFLLLLVLVGGAFSPGYSHLSQYISELGAMGAPYEMLVRFGGFLPAGAFLALFNIAATKRLPETKLVTWGQLGLSIFAMGYIVAVIFPCEPGCPEESDGVSQSIHNLVGMAGYVVAPVFLTVLGIAARTWPNRGNLPIVAFTCAGVALLGLISLNPESSYVGLSQRAIEASVWVWALALGRYVSR